MLKKLWRVSLQECSVNSRWDLHKALKDIQQFRRLFCKVLRQLWGLDPKPIQLKRSHSHQSLDEIALWNTNSLNEIHWSPDERDLFLKDFTTSLRSQKQKRNTCTTSTFSNNSYAVWITSKIFDILFDPSQALNLIKNPSITGCLIRIQR